MYVVTGEEMKIFERKCLLQYQESNFVCNAEHPPTLVQERPTVSLCPLPLTGNSSSDGERPTNTPCLCTKRLLLTPVENVRVPAGKPPLNLRAKHPDPSDIDRDPTHVSSILCPRPHKLQKHWTSAEGTEFIDKWFSFAQIHQYSAHVHL